MNHDAPAAPTDPGQLAKGDEGVNGLAVEPEEGREGLDVDDVVGIFEGPGADHAKVGGFALG